MKTKRVSALAVFKKLDSQNDPPVCIGEKTTVKRSASDASASVSLTSISKKKNGNFLRALKSGTLKNRNSDSARKSRPSFLPDSMLDSPYLTAITQMKDSPNLAAIKTRKKKSPATQKEEKEIRKKIVKPEEKENGSDEIVEEEVNLPYMFDSNVEAKKMFEYIIHPVTINNFFQSNVGT